MEKSGIHTAEEQEAPRQDGSSVDSIFRQVMPEGKKYRPVFAGKTKKGEKIILYDHADRRGEIYIQLPSGRVRALSLRAKVTMVFTNGEDTLSVQIESPQWTGIAVGTRKDLIEADALSELP